MLFSFDKPKMAPRMPYAVEGGRTEKVKGEEVE
jgi:hypothetical protein